MALTTKMRAFVEAYCGNATEAAITAGYSKKTARIIAAKLLSKVNIKEALKEREDRRLASLIATREERQRFWTEIMRNSAEETRDRLRAAELLGKSEADFVEKISLNAKTEVSCDEGLEALLKDPESRKLLAALYARSASGGVESAGES